MYDDRTSGDLGLLPSPLLGRPDHVKGVSHERRRANKTIERKIGEHAHQGERHSV